MQMPWSSEGTRSPGAGATSAHELPNMGAGPEHHPLQEQQGLLTAAPPHQPLQHRWKDYPFK